MDSSDGSTPNQLYDLVIVGGSAGGLSTAISSLRSGLRRVRIIESSSRVALPDLIGPNQLDVGFGETVSTIDLLGDSIVVDTNRLSYRTRAVLVADRRDAVLAALPAEKSPTVNQLANGDYAIETVVEKVGINELIPALREAGATDLLEIPISKIIH